MEILLAKLLAILSLGVGTILVGLLPSCFMNQGPRQSPLFLSTLLCFGGGVLLSTSLIHILPEARQQMSKYQEYAELIYCGGFFLLYVIDEVVHLFYNDDHHTHNHSSNDNNLNRRHSCGPQISSTYGSTERYTLLEKQPPYNPIMYKARSDGHLNCDDETPSQLCHVSHQEPCDYGGTIANLGLLLALSTHAVLEGLIVGLAKTSSNVMLFLGAIASHKLVVGFCLGAELAANPRNTLCRNFVYIFIFTFGSLLGIIIGMLIYRLPKQAIEFAIPILQTIAGGTLLYVTVSEVLPRERARWHQQHTRKGAGVFQFLAVAIGFVGMTIMSKYLDFD